MIVGGIDDIQEGQLDAAPRAAMYLPLYQDGETSFAVLARTGQDERTILPALESTLKSIDPGMAIYDPMTMEEKIHDAPATYLHRSSAWLVGSFALMALLLGVVGLYGVIAYSVSQRTREIGVRMALGAQRGAIYSMVMREAGLLTAIGIALGLACSIAAALAIRSCSSASPPGTCPPSPPSPSYSPLLRSPPAFCPRAALPPSIPPTPCALNRAMSPGSVRDFPCALSAFFCLNSL